LDPAPGDRPSVPVSPRRRRKRRRIVARAAKYAACGLVALSVVLAIFVHRGLLGIAGLVGAAVVGAIMLHPRKWLWPDEDEDFTAPSG
jgi:hypothetical protein